MKILFNVFPCIFVGLGLNKLLDFSKFIHPKVCILQCFGMNKLLGQLPTVRPEIGTKSLSLSVFFVADPWESAPSDSNFDKKIELATSSDQCIHMTSRQDPSY